MELLTPTLLDDCEVEGQCQKAVRTVLADSLQNLINPIIIIIIIIIIAIVLEFNLFLNTTHSIITIILNIK